MPFTDPHAAGNAILVVPVVCKTRVPGLCDVGEFDADRAGRPSPVKTLDDYVNPLLRLKLQLAGYALADAKTMKLQPAERTTIETIDDVDGQTRGGAVTRVTDVPTVVELSDEDRLAVARSLGLAGVLRSEIRVERRSLMSQLDVELRVELVDAQTARPRWTVTCHDDYEHWDATLEVLANCVGDGVLVWRAPEAVIEWRRP